MANLSNINDKFLVTTGGNILIGQTGIVGSSILQVTGGLDASNIGLGTEATAFGGGVPTIVFKGTTNNNRAGALRFKTLDGTDVAAMYVTNGADGYGTTLTAYAGSIKFQTVSLSAPKMTILTGGNVGIGVTSPVGKLQVSLPTYTNEDTNSQQAIFGVDSGYGVRIGYNETDNKGYINVLKPGVAWGSLILQEDVGKVGIGTTTPVYNLVVSNGGASGIEFAINTATGLNEMLSYNRSTSVFEKFRAQAKQFEWYTDATSNALVIQSGGNVGIGTSSPAAGSQLTLRSSASTGMTILSASNTGECFINFSDNDDANVGQIFYGHSPDRMAFRVGDDTRMTILGSNGNVGIGYTNPSYKFQVLSNKAVSLNIGCYVNSQGPSTTNTAFYADASQGTSNNWAFYAASGNSYFANGIRLGGNGSSNELDDYEEGTWTPVPKGGTTAGTFSSPAGHQTGTYTKIGQTVHISMMLFATSFTGVGNFEIHGLPFAVGGSAGTMAVQANSPPWTLSVNNQNITAYPTLTKIAFRATNWQGGGGFIVAQCGGSTTIGYIRISGVYHS